MNKKYIFFGFSALAIITVYIMATKEEIKAKFVTGAKPTQSDFADLINHTEEFTTTIDTTDADLNITDEQGNVIARFQDGHIKTKNFDSANVYNTNFVKKIYECSYSGNFMHISFDDTSTSMSSLFESSHSSIFDVSFFNSLKTLHDEFGACFSLYVYVESLANVTNTYAAEFQANKSWLKFNFHTLNDTKYNTNDIDEDYQLGIQRLLTMCGNDKECLDHQIRGNYWEMSLSNAKKIRDNSTHSSYIMSAKDMFSTSTGNYYLDENQKASVRKNGIYIDCQNRLIFIQTCARLDTDEYTEQSKNYISSNIKWRKHCEVLNHEWGFNESRMRSFLSWAEQYNFTYGFFDNIYTL